MLRTVKFLGRFYEAWICPNDLIPHVWKVGTLLPGQIWGQVDTEGPYRPVWPVETE